MRKCFILSSVIIANAGLLSAATVSKPAPVLVIVRSDMHSGRLVRSLARPVRPVPEKADPQIELPASAQAAPTALATLVDHIAQRHDVDRDLVHSMIRVASNYNPFAVSNKGALGLMQLIPSTARRFGVANVFDPAQNVEGGVRYLKYLLDLYEGDNRLALAAYNAGEGTVERYRGVPPFRETRDYVYRVGKALDETREANKQRNAEASAKPATEFNPVRAFVDAMGRMYYKTQ